MNVLSLYQRTLDTWLDRVLALEPGHWADPTPCDEWSVRDLVNHVVGEDRWTVPLLEGSTVQEVGDRFDGDLLGDDPVAAAVDAGAAARAAVDEKLPGGGTVHLSYGEERVEEYVGQLAADHLVHAWDLAVATGGERRLDQAVVGEVADWFQSRAPLYRAAGLVTAPITRSGGDAQDALLGQFGRDPGWGPDHACLAAFSSAFGRGDVDAIMALMSEDCVFESTGPAPDGLRHDGAAAVRAQWEQVFGDTGAPVFEEEERFLCGDRGVLRWRFSWQDADGRAGHVRGADVLRLRGGLVVEKLSYVKG